jgi:hypothetical protein
MEYKGWLTLYGATGEPIRLQFIGNGSLSDGMKFKDRHVVKYDEIWDLEVGDQIQFLSNFGPKYDTVMAPIDERFLEFFTASFVNGMNPKPVAFIPHVNHKSWGQLDTEFKSKGVND